MQARIAVIDDEDTVLEAFSQALERNGYLVDTFDTKDAAIRGLSTNKYDVVVLDIRMNGDESAGLVVFGSLPPPPNRPPVLFVSGHPEVKTLRPMLLAMRAWDYLVKPIEEQTLVLKVEQLLNIVPIRNGTTSFGSLSWDASNPGAVRWKDDKLAIPNTGYCLMLDLVDGAGKVVPYSKLLKRLVSGRTRDNLRNHIKLLRDEFRGVDPTFNAIRTTAGEGYSWNE